MITGFAARETEKIWHGTVSRRLPISIQRIGRRKLRMLNNARDLDDLRVPPGNRLERLKGNRKGQHSIRIKTSGGFASGGLTATRIRSKSPITIRQ